MAQRAVYEGRILDYVWLEVDQSVIHWQSTLFSSDNAVARRAIIDANCRTAMESSSIQAEVLVHERIDQRWITFPRPKALSLSEQLANILRSGSTNGQ